MMKGARGLYETLVTQALEIQLAELDTKAHAERDALRPAEAADRLALHLARVVRRALEGVDDKERVSVGIRLAKTLIDAIDTSIIGAEVTPDTPTEPGSILQRSLASFQMGAPRPLPRRSTAARYHAADECPGRASRRQPNPHGDSFCRPNRSCDGVHSA